MKLLIAIHHPFELWTAPPWVSERLRAEFPGHHITQLPGPKYEGMEREIADADAAITWSIRRNSSRTPRSYAGSTHRPLRSIN
jgi:hypothetical protein